MQGNRPRPTHPRVALVVLDGFGASSVQTANAVLLARTPVLNTLSRVCPPTLLQASGEAVGLPANQMGNSEVGHTTMGAGRVLYQDLPRINHAIQEGSLAQHPLLQQAFAYIRTNNATLHIIGLTSEGGIHAHLTHGLALLRCAQEAGVPRVAWHAFLDGRDTPPRSAMPALLQVEAALAQSGIGVLASLVGRFYAMDRDERWERTEQAYRLLLEGQGQPFAAKNGATPAVEQAYARGQTDEFIEPVVFTDAEGRPLSTIQSKDVVVFFHFRADRARQLATALCADHFSAFARPFVLTPNQLLCLTRYDANLPVPVLFPPLSVAHHLGATLSTHHLRQFRVAETEKYAHVTFFFGCGQEAPSPGEERVLVPSRQDVATYDAAPEMRTPEIAAHLVHAIESERYAFLLANFASPDMVGHTGTLPAAIQAVEHVDACLGTVLQAAQHHETYVVITSDHGNCETMVDSATGQPHTAHTTNPVPCWLMDPTQTSRLLPTGELRDIAPTVLDLLGLPKPIEMTGTSLRTSTILGKP